jgi:hypothetical protein
VTHDEERHGTTTLYAALNLAPGEIRRLAVSSVDELIDAMVESIDRRNGLSP